MEKSSGAGDVIYVRYDGDIWEVLSMGTIEGRMYYMLGITDSGKPFWVPVDECGEAFFELEDEPLGDEPYGSDRVRA